MKAPQERFGSQDEADDTKDKDGSGKPRRRPLPGSVFAIVGSKRESGADVLGQSQIFTRQRLAETATGLKRRKSLNKRTVKSKDFRPDRASENLPETVEATKDPEITANAPGTDEATETDSYEQWSDRWSKHELGLEELHGGEVIDLRHDLAEKAGRKKESSLGAAEQADEREVGFAEYLDASNIGRMRRQEEQQHQALAAESLLSGEPDPAEPTPATGGGTPPSPPGGPPGPPNVFEFPSGPDPNLPPSSSPEPAQVYREYVQRAAAAQEAAPHGQSAATKEDVEDAVYRAARTGHGQAMAAGLIVGYYEHLKHKRRERKAEKVIRKKTKQLDAVRQSYEFGVREQERQQAETSARLQSAEQRLQGAEQRMQSAEKRAEDTVRRVAQVQQAAPEAQGQFVLPPEHRLETSAWHAIEVDAKTGKAVENPSIQYGREYHNERAQEIAAARKRDAVASEAAALAVGSAAGGGAGGTAPVGDTPTSSPPVSIPNATMQGSPQSIQQRTQDSARDGKPDPAPSTAPLWPWVVALLVIAVCLIVALG